MNITDVIQKVIRAILLVSSGIFLCTVLAIMIDGFHDQIHKSDVAIVFGSKVYSNGHVSPRLAARLDKAVELYKQHMFSIVIVSGGTGKEGVDEAIEMKKYLIGQHIPGTSILLDSHGSTTFETAKNSASIMHEHGYKSAIIISQYFHITRARLALKQNGIATIHNAHANFFEWRDVYSVAREVIGYYDYLFRNYLLSNERQLKIPMHRGIAVVENGNSKLEIDKVENYDKNA